MGTYLSTPVKDKGQEEGSCLQGEIPTAWGVVDMQGWRKSMEDAHVAQSFTTIDNSQQPQVTRCFAVFDGHGGAEVARFCALYLVAVWKRQIQQQQAASSDAGNDAAAADCGEALKRTFHELDRMIDDEARRDELIRLRAISPAPGEQRELPPPLLLENGDTNQKNSTNDDDDDDSPPPQTMFSPPPPHSVTPPPPHKDPSINADGDDDADVEPPPLQQDDGNDVIQTATESTMAQSDNDEEPTTLAVTPPPPDGKLAVPLGSSSSSSEDSMDEEETDSQDAAGILEAAELDQDLSSDEEDDDDEKESLPPAIVENGDSPATNGNTDKTDKYDDFTAKNKVVTSMFQRFLNLSGPSGQVVLQVDQSLAANNNSGSPTTPPFHTSSAVTSIPPAQGPPATLMRNGQMLCNLADHPIHAGATAIVAVLQGRRLTVANAGDSRAVLCRAHGATKALSFDHKPMQQRELNRIKAAGGFVNSFGRVNGNLNLSRSIGDLKYKQTPGLPPEEQMITAEPDIEQ